MIIEMHCMPKNQVTFNVRNILRFMHRRWIHIHPRKHMKTLVWYWGTARPHEKERARQYCKENGIIVTDRADAFTIWVPKNWSVKELDKW